MTREQLEELAALDAVGALDGADAVALESACAADPAAAALRAEFHDAAGAFAVATAPRLDAPDALRQCVMDKVFGPAGPTVRDTDHGTFGRGAWAAAAAIAVLALAGASATTRSKESVVVRDVRSDAGAPFVALSGYGDFARSSASVLWDSGQRGWWMQAAGLPALPPTHGYRVWAIGPETGQIYDCGPLPVGRDGTGRRFLTPPGEINSMRGFAVSIEPLGAEAPQPTSPAILLTPALRG